MARIISGPVEKTVTCNECGSVIGYLPEEVDEHHGRDISGGPDGYKRVKCPRPKCPGYGYISRW